MNLFNFKEDSTRNLLPYDGTVNYYGHILSNEAANQFQKILLETIEWKNDITQTNGLNA